jgi:hypothetical protein
MSAALARVKLLLSKRLFFDLAERKNVLASYLFGTFSMRIDRFSELISPGGGGCSTLVAPTQVRPRASVPLARSTSLFLEWVCHPLLIQRAPGGDCLNSHHHHSLRNMRFSSR